MKKPKIPAEVQTRLTEIEKQIMLDESLRRLWFKRVLTPEEITEIMRLYCRRIGQYEAADLGNRAITDKIVRELERVIFLIKGVR